jgi:hypothetical protein
MLKRFFVLCYLLSLLGCAVTIESQLPLIKTGMTKVEVDKILEDRGKWIGKIDTEEGVRGVWGYPSTSFGLTSMFDPSSLQQRYYLFFEGDKYINYSNSFNRFLPRSKTDTPAGVGSPGALGGGGMMGGGPMGMPPGGETGFNSDLSPATQGD